MSTTEQDLYSLLNVTKDATDQEIKQSFKFLSRLFHPDKLAVIDAQDELTHSNGTSSAILASNFQQIVYAYQVLSDPQKRTVYDLYGHDGLSKYYGLCTLNNGNQSTDHVLALLKKEREAALRHQQEQQLKCVSKATVTLDASGNFDSYEEYVGLEVPELHSIVVYQSFSSKVTDSFSAAVGYKLGNSFGRGTGSISSTLLFTPSPSSQLQWSLGVGSEKFLNTTYTRIISPRWYFQIGMHGPIKHGALYPHLQANIAYAIVPSCTVNASLLLGFQNHVALSVRKGYGQDMRSFAECSIQQTVQQESNLDLKHKHFLNNQQDLFLKNKLKLSTHGHMAQIGLGGIPISSALCASFSIETGSLLGVVLRFGLGRRDDESSITVPVFLSHEFDPLLSLFGAIVPPAIVLATSHFIAPIVQHITGRVRKKRQSLPEGVFREDQHQTYLKVAALMAKIAHRKIQHQRQTNGLIITWAAYGPAGAQWNESNCLDITGHLNALIDTATSSLTLNVFPFQLIGMYNPCVGEETCTRIEYLFAGQQRKVELSENQFIRLPQSQADPNDK